jgi:hypothetical protein
MDSNIPRQSMLGQTLIGMTVLFPLFDVQIGSCDCLGTITVCDKFLSYK